MSDKLTWYDVSQWGFEGQAWNDVAAPFDRLPERAHGLVRPAVWDLGQHAAGLSVRFQSNATDISIRWRLRFEPLAKTHMPATGVSGIDLYARDDDDPWFRVGIGRPEKFPDNCQQIAGDLDGTNRQYLLYLPLYNGVQHLEIGVPTDAAFTGTEPRVDKPILFYGTSITQGACASRPGMAYPAILGRLLARPVINLGFNGNGIMDIEIAELLSEVNAEVFFLDCLPNMTAELIAERTEPFVRTLRDAHPETPIVLAGNPASPAARVSPAAVQRHQTCQAALRRAYENLLQSGIEHLRYVSGQDQLGADSEGTVDGTHPNDLGFWRMAKVFHPVLKGLC